MTELLQRVERYVRNLLKDQSVNGYVFHDLRHTIRVVKACKEIAEKTGVTDTQLEELLIAAWFHDAGYVSGKDDHEEKSAAVARKFLSGEGVSPERIDVICNCLMATKMPQTPSNLMQQIICDADLSGLGSLHFMEEGHELRKEQELFQGATFTDEEWLESQVHFLTSHNYFTEAAKALFQEQKQRNIQHLLSL
ncbi:MAG: HD domain-containing protein [Flavobacteriales bacterium]|nr:HD domain-containing protein [Flavobacteriales bacterium]